MMAGISQLLLFRTKGRNSLRSVYKKSSRFVSMQKPKTPARGRSSRTTPVGCSREFFHKSESESESESKCVSPSASLCACLLLSHVQSPKNVLLDSRDLRDEPLSIKIHIAVDVCCLKLLLSAYYSGALRDDLGMQSALTLYSQETGLSTKHVW